MNSFYTIVFLSLSLFLLPLCVEAQGQEPFSTDSSGAPDPLAISPAIAAQIGSDQEPEPFKMDKPRTSFFPPFYVGYQRRAWDANEKLFPFDEQSLYCLLYYRRRSVSHDADVFFPLFWKMREQENHTLVVGPWVSRYVPDAADRWLVPLLFTGSRKEGGYFGIPPFLTFSYWDTSSAFTWSILYFRSRQKQDISSGLFPFYMWGEKGALEEEKKRYLAIPPLLFYSQFDALESSSLTVAGPIIMKSTPNRSYFHVVPLFFHIHGNPKTGGERETHTTLLPLFHTGHTERESLLVLPGYLRHKTPTSDTLITPFYSRAYTRGQSAVLTAMGPILPLYWSHHDTDLASRSYGFFPLFYASSSPTGRDFLTPLVGRFESYGIYQRWWFLPTWIVGRDREGWEANLYPLLYVRRGIAASHTVVVPLFWDYASAKGRTTIGFPGLWRFESVSSQSVTQVVLNTLYLQKRVSGGLDWQFHFLPLFSCGASPQGHWWNMLFGLVGYQKSTQREYLKAFWVPFRISGKE
ncbi:hypothetical protein [Pajaroellobacter abortibovis]|uniref:Uncharacterized protein n=1 Tax=Pajaroellobacter abortibovis TaxID=1882918 RepID=A0A1L6MX25_9BACT|nr:hypothetical protein [Pajaroellobacter abortibovis]APS00072.1 hypothetical protein BCY86_04800 [Pajaroellobacter abortibovis]